MQKQEAQYEKMIRMPVPKLILSLAVPAMMSMLISSAYNTADAWFVAKLGTTASGAIGIVFSLMALIQAVGFTVGMGAGTTISGLLGEKEEEKAQQTASSSLVLSVLLGVLISILGLLFLKPLMQLLGATGTILPRAVEYASCILYAAPVMTASFVLNNLLRAEGRTGYAMAGIALGGILNVALDPLFIFGFHMGIRGASLATSVSQTAGFLVLLAFFLRKKTILRLSLKHITWRWSVYGTFLKNGMPSLFRQGLASAAAVALNRTAASWGDAAVAAMAVVGKIFMVVYCMLIGFGQGYQPAAGYNHGAGEYKRVRSAFHFTLWIGTIGMSLLGIGMYAAAPWLLGMFAGEDRQMMETGILALRLLCVVMPLMPLGVVCNLTFQAVGRPVLATFLAACRQGVFFLPFLWLFSQYFGIAGMAASQPAADAATFLVCLPFAVSFLRHLKQK